MRKFSTLSDKKHQKIFSFFPHIRHGFSRRAKRAEQKKPRRMPRPKSHDFSLARFAPLQPKNSCKAPRPAFSRVYRGTAAKKLFRRLSRPPSLPVGKRHRFASAAPFPVPLLLRQYCIICAGGNFYDIRKELFPINFFRTARRP